MSLLGKLKKFFGGVEDSAGKDFGEVEALAGRPLYPISPYFAQVSPALWRGSWPNVRILAELKENNVRTVINLCGERSEDPATQKGGFLVTNFQIIDNTPPVETQVRQFLNLVRECGPVYVHCEEGKGRTGCMVAAYRVKVEGWTPKAALEEAEKYGLCMPDQKQFILAL